MKMNNLIDFLMTTMILFGPLIWIYLILYTLNWNQRENLLSDSWIIFIVLLISSFAVFFAFLIADANFYGFSNLRIPLLFLLVLIVINTFSVAAVLNHRENKKNISIADNSNKEINQNTGNQKILMTSAIISILTIAMVSSLIIFVNEISTIRIEEKSRRSDSGYAVYE